MGGLKARASGLLARARAARPAFDHLVRMQNRMSRTRGSMLAGSVTYSAFVSIFPILLLAVSVLGFVLAGNPSAQADVLKNVTKVIPGDLGSSLLTSVQSARGATGAIGLVGVAVSGLGWLGSLRTAVQLVWNQNAISQNAVVAKLQDALTLSGFALLLVLSTAAAGTATGQAKNIAQAFVGGDPTGLKILLQVLGYVVAIAANYGLFLFMYRRLSRVDRPRARFRQGSLLAAILFWLLQNVLFFVIQHTLNSSSQVYGATIGGFFALLLYIRYVTLIMLYTACWMATAPGQDDVLPSGTALLALPDEEAAHVLGTSLEKAEVAREKLAGDVTGGHSARPDGGISVRPDGADDDPADPGPELVLTGTGTQVQDQQTRRPALSRLARGGHL